MVAKKHTPSFEEQLQRLQEIVTLLEDSTLPLETSIQLYKEGITLSSSCRTQLEKAQHEVKILTEAGTLEPFDPSSLEPLEDIE